MGTNLIYRSVVISTLSLVASLIAFPLEAICEPEKSAAPASWLISLPTTIGTIIAACIAFFAAWMAARISYSNKISEFRQAWIIELRADIADYVAAAELWFRKWDELNFLSNEEKQQRERAEALPLSVAARTILNRIKLRLNPRENLDKAEDDLFLQSLTDLLDPGKINPQNPDSAWRVLSNDAVEKGRKILKREWETTKTVFSPLSL